MFHDDIMTVGLWQSYETCECTVVSFDEGEQRCWWLGECEWSVGRMILGGRAEVLGEESVPTLLRPPQNLTWTDLVLNPAFRRERRSATCLSYGTDTLQSGTYSHHCWANMIVTHVHCVGRK